MYVPVKGGEQAIAASRIAVERSRRGDDTIPEIEINQIMAQMSLALDRIMSEGGLYDRRFAAIAFKQAQGDIAEAVFLVRAHRAQLANFGSSQNIDLKTMHYSRHISATQKELAGGQILGATYDYTHRLLNMDLEHSRPQCELPKSVITAPSSPSSSEPLYADLIRTEISKAPIDITRTVLPSLPDPCERLAHLARGEEGYLTGLAYESLRKASTSYPYVAQLMRGSVEIFVELEDLNLTVSIGEVELTACTTVAPNFSSSPHLEAGFGIAFGANERKAVAMAIVDQHFKIEGATSDALMHTDGVAASGYVSHLKLPHYSDFDADLARLRRVQAKEEI